MAKKILSVSYDEPLLTTREMLLAQAGYQVTSALGFDQALKHCSERSYDLVIMGQSIPLRDKQSLLEAVRKFDGVPVLGLRLHGEGPMAGVDYSIENSEGPAALLGAVKKTLGANPKKK
jgi:DNA-binding response OmpR family regulator